MNFILKMVGFIAVAFVTLVFVSWQEARSSSGYREDFIEIYGDPMDEYFDFGEDGLKARWLSEEQEAKLNCELFETCSFIEIATVTRCTVAIKVAYSLLSESDQVLKSEELLIHPLQPGKLRVVEIGTNAKIDFQYFNPENLTCVNEPLAL